MHRSKNLHIKILAFLLPVFFFSIFNVTFAVTYYVPFNVGANSNNKSSFGPAIVVPSSGSGGTQLLNSRNATCGPCVANRADYPNGDPNCVNGYYRYDYYNNVLCSYNTSGSTAGNSSGNISNNPSGGISCNRSAPKNFKELVENIFIGCILSPLIPVLSSIALIVFLWGVFSFIRAEDDKKKAEGRQFILWGLIGLFVMVSVWGLIRILGNTFNLNNSGVTPTNISSPF